MADTFGKRPFRFSLDTKRTRSSTKNPSRAKHEAVDWQISRHDIKSRGHYLFDTGTLTDCNFLVGREPKDQKLIAAHKLILAMASPVFHTMFYGSLPENNIMIHVTDLNHAAFHTLLKYIYTDEITIDSVDDAIELYHAAKKYMLSFVVEQCLAFILAKLTPKTAFRVYEFATFFDEPKLKKRSLEIIRNQTLEAIQDDSFQNAEVETVMMVVEQDRLQITSELELFEAINKYATKSPTFHPEFNRDSINCKETQTVSAQFIVPLKGKEVETTTSTPTASDEKLQPNPSDNESSEPDDKPKESAVAVGTKEPPTEPSHSEDSEQQPASITIRDLVRRIRFLTLSAQQFAEGPLKTKLLTQPESFAILANIASPDSGIPMPEGFSTNRTTRNGSFSFKRGGSDAFSNI
ncbi:BTB/POZ domain-containing protein 6-B-like [Malaya genurostris]|uniref:BTB/POZ domain-containing protein 6-B-like n=1 Tax=Malaya genurostris TaxID=325434 RepID=UPI0026F3BBA6|nr:BTB/POZ domain-containing protein 6-B-like [Malaya genurostris]